ncbi:MAG: ABC transporter ATP-binding protein [Planctomycetota bacterium]|nr:ABC transporter ATP-binding protein [Planctomycetota bacterium]
MIIVDHVYKSYGAFKAVSDLTFSVPAGSVCGFLGPNGAGKTTTIRMLAGAIQPNAGRLVLAGKDVRTDSRSSRGQLGYLPESNPLPSELTVSEYLKFRCALWGVDRAKRRASIDRVIDRCGLAEVRNKLLGSLSRGFRQRAGLAAALVASPAVVILDEPGTGLDPTTAMAFRTLVRSLRGEHTILFSSHNLAEVEATCDHLVLIARGKLVADGSAIDLRRLGAVGVRFEIESTHCDPVALRQIVGVLGVQTHSMQDGWIRLSVEIEPNGDSFATATALSEALHSSAGKIRRFERANPALEEIFQRLVGERGGEHVGERIEGASR